MELCAEGRAALFIVPEGVPHGLPVFRPRQPEGGLLQLRNGPNAAGGKIKKRQGGPGIILGVPQNDALAFSWFEKAAAQGNTGARIKLGFMYAKGRATQKEGEAAYAWIMAAYLAGDQRGLPYLKALETQLSPSQLERAKHRAEELWAVRDVSSRGLALVP